MRLETYTNEIGLVAYLFRFNDPIETGRWFVRYWQLEAVKSTSVQIWHSDRVTKFD